MLLTTISVSIEATRRLSDSSYTARLGSATIKFYGGLDTLGPQAAAALVEAGQ